MLERFGALFESFEGVTSVLVTQHGTTAAEWYVEGDGGRTTLRNTRSATKTVTGMLVGLAVDDGRIDVDAPVASYLDGDSTEGLPAGITIRDLLTMSSCLDCDDSDTDSPGNEERMYPLDDWLGFARSIQLRSPCGPPTFRYCTAHTVLLGAAVEAACGVELAENADSRLFEPLGISERRWFRSGPGRAFPGGGLELRSRDLGVLGALYLNGSSCEGRQLISTDWVEQSTTRWATVDEVTRYGYLLWLRGYATPSGVVDGWLMLGNGGNKVAILPQLDAVVVITAVNFGMPGMHELTDRLLQQHVLPEL